MLKVFSKTYKLIIAVFLIPVISFAQTNDATCLKNGYTIETINGIFTDEAHASDNKIALQKYFPSTYHNEPLTVDYLLNPSHLWGVGDLVMSVYQKFFESETVSDYDLIEILKDASAKVQTQKLLLVAHSQGNFYANSFYDVVAGKAGGLPTQSIGVYSVANPASRVAGNGKWLTSDTDNVIAGLVAHLAPFHSIMPTNTHIAETAGSWDPLDGHDFTQVYLKYRAEEIVKGIQDSLDKLSSDPARHEDVLCIDPPKITIAHQVAGVALGVADTALSTTAGAFAASYNTYANIAVWVYNTGGTIASTAYNAILASLSSGSLAGNNGASVILATQPAQMPSSASVNNNQATTVAIPVAQTQTAPAPTQPQPQVVFVFEPKVQNGASAPKLVFIGSFGGGAPPQAAPQILGMQTTVFVADEATATGEVVGNAGVALATPALSVPQCAQTLATDGCLLATTTVHFEWTAVPGADHYLINKNGEYATTTETSLDISAPDFSDYTLCVVAIGFGGQASATSTQAVSVATIPIAINEIAWMGTVASTTNEWFEIKNNTMHTVDISQWELNAKDGTPHVRLSGTINPKEYLVFERISDNTISDVSAHQIYTGALGNKGEQLNLSYASTTFDQTPEIANGKWVAGYNSTSSRQTMERYSSREPGADPANWGTNLGYIKNGTDANGNAIEGTPGAQNSVSTLINKGQDITSDLTLTNAEEQYVIANELRVGASSTLTVGPGVAIKFYDGWIYDQGHLAVAGTQENPVTIGTFSGNRNGGISVGGGYVDTVYHGANASAVFDNANIENINYISAYDNARLDISNTDLLNSSGGIYASGNAQLSISSSTIRNTQDNHAVAGYQNSKITIASSSITNTLGSDVIGVYDGAMTITNTTIDGAPNDGGIYAYRATLDISNSTIKNVSDTGMSLYGSTSTISNVTIENTGNVGIEIYQGQTTIASTTVSGVAGWAGIEVDYGTLAISSSTLRNVSNYGISTYKATSTISNVVLENGGGNGIDIYQGTAKITDTAVSGFGGSGISVTDPTEPVAITGGEVTGNAIGIDMEAGSAIINPVASVHDNGTSPADNVVTW